jgi:putative oxidoreductase
MFTDTTNAISRFFYQRSFGLFILRAATGLIFLLHGWMKVTNMTQTVGMFAHMGFSMPIAYFIAWLEVIGGAALILGVATRFFALLFGIEMLVATFVVGFGRGLGIEFYLAMVSFAIALIGSGRLSVFKMECETCGGFLCDGSATACISVE